MAAGAHLDPIRVAVIDDHPIVASALAAASAQATVAAERGVAEGSLSEPTPGTRPDGRPITVVAVGRTLAEGIAIASSTGPNAPDVLVCDVQLERDAEGLLVLDAARRHGLAVIMLTSFGRSSFMRESFERGAAGFLTKETETGAIIDAIRTVAGGGTVFPTRVLDAIRNAPREPSEREREVLERLRDGDSNDEIGVRLGVSPRTVESHLRRLFDRYGVLSRTELVVLALSEGWIAGGR